MVSGQVVGQSIDEAKIDRICQMYQGGASLDIICADCGVYGSQIVEAIRSKGLPLRWEAAQYEVRPELTAQKSALEQERAARQEKLKQRLAIQQTVREQVVRLYEQEGLSARKISDTLGLRYKRVRTILHEANVTLLPGNRGREWQKQRVEIRKALVEEGLSTQEVMARFGITASALNGLIHDELKLKPVDFRSPQFYETLVNEVLMRISEQTGINLMAKGTGASGETQLQLFETPKVGPDGLPQI